jgi:hypothetical protein
MASGKSSRPSHMIGTGWISEVFPRKGVLTFTSPASGEDERVLFLASKVYIFEKRFGTKQSLDQVPPKKTTTSVVLVPVPGNGTHSLFYESLYLDMHS